MKKTIALIAAVCCLSFANAQQAKEAPTGTTATPQGRTPEIMAKRHTKNLQHLLGLSEDQTKKTYDILLVRLTEAKAVRDKAGPDADKKALREQLKPIRLKFITEMNGILTPGQRTKWEEHRAQMKQNREKANGNTTTPPANGAKKGANDEDGIGE